MSGGIPVTYVPARNTIFLSFALAWAEVIGAGDIFIGVNALDYSGYPDCRPEYITAFEHMANLATRAGVEDRTLLRIHAPLIEWSKREIIAAGLALGVDYSRTRAVMTRLPPGWRARSTPACPAQGIPGERSRSRTLPAVRCPTPRLTADGDRTMTARSRRSLHRRVKAPTAVVPRCSVGLRAATSGQAVKLTGRMRCADSVIPSSQAPTDPEAGSSRPGRPWHAQFGLRGPGV
jgi:hypothetical protein